jgi:hypothetical protein
MTLTAQIEASLWREEELRAEVSAMRAGVSPAEARDDARRRVRAAHEARGGAWLRPFRRWDGYREAVEAALRQLREREDAPTAERQEELVRR